MAKNVKESDMSNGLYGKITNKSGMYIKAGYPQDGGKAPQVRKGSDLRVGNGKVGK